MFVDFIGFFSILPDFSSQWVQIWYRYAEILRTKKVVHLKPSPGCPYRYKIFAIKYEDVIHNDCDDTGC